MKLVHNDGLEICFEIHAFLTQKSSISPIFVCLELGDEGVSVYYGISVYLNLYGILDTNKLETNKLEKYFIITQGFSLIIFKYCATVVNIKYENNMWSTLYCMLCVIFFQNGVVVGAEAGMGV